MFFLCRYVVHAEVEEVWLPAAAVTEGRTGPSPGLPLHTQSETWYGGTVVFVFRIALWVDLAAIQG